MDHAAQAEIDALLSRLRAGEKEAEGELFARLQAELRDVAARVFRSQRAAHTLQPTALVNEAYLKMAGRGEWQDRAHFLAVAATAMRQILVNHARDRGAKKRGGGADRARVTLSGVVIAPDETEIDALDIDEALKELAVLDPDQARIVELRCFAGLSNPEVAEVVGRSLRTVEGDWKMAKAWLAKRLGAGPARG